MAEFVELFEDIEGAEGYEFSLFGGRVDVDAVLRVFLATSIAVKLVEQQRVRWRTLEARKEDGLSIIEFLAGSSHIIRPIRPVHPATFSQTTLARSQHEAGSKRMRVHGARSFAAGIRVDPELHYYIKPDISELVTDLVKRKYCLLTGHRQSGKSTSIFHALEEASRGQEFVPVVLSRGILDVQRHWSEEQMWKRLCKLLHLASPTHFSAVQDDKLYLSDDFVECFAIQRLRVPVLLVIDEADTLLKLNEDCIDALLHNVRIIKSEPERYNLWTMVLVGTDRVKDLIELRYHVAAQQPGYEASRSTPSVYSPFPHDHVLSSTRFKLEDIEALLRQFLDDFPESGVSVRSMAESILELTDGHKGLTGTCLAFMDQEKAYSLEKWNALVANNMLVTHVFSLATYARVMEAAKENATKTLYRTLKPFVEFARVRYGLNAFDDGARDMRAYIASGVLIVDWEHPYCYVRLSSPLLRMSILSRLAVKNFSLGKAPPRRLLRTEEDRVWVVETVLELLDGKLLQYPEVLLNNDTPSEYVYQFAFMARLKVVLEQAYPSMGLQVLPEVREVRVAGQQRSLLRTDTLVVNGSGFKRFAVECLVFGTSGSNGSLRSHYVKALRYASQHSAVVYLVNITMDESFNELVPDSPDVVFVGVEFRTGADVARVKFIYSGTNRPVLDHTLNLRRWTGEVEYEWM